MKHTLGHENCTPVVQEIGRALERDHGVIQNAKVRTEDQDLAERHSSGCKLLHSCEPAKKENRELPRWTADSRPTGCRMPW